MTPAPIGICTIASARDTATIGSWKLRPATFFSVSKLLAIYLHVALTNGWGGYLLTEYNYLNAFFSHDEFIDFFADHEETLRDVIKPFAGDQVE